MAKGKLNQSREGMRELLIHHLRYEIDMLRCTFGRGDWEFVIGVNIWGIIHGIRVRPFLRAHQPMRAAAQ